MCNQDYKTLVAMPGKAGTPGAWIALVQHNWNEAEAGERRISWAETEANARLIAAAPELLELAAQYRSDMLHPPTPDSRERRIARIDAVLTKANGGQP